MLKRENQDRRAFKMGLARGSMCQLSLGVAIGFTFRVKPTNGGVHGDEQ